MKNIVTLQIKNNSSGGSNQKYFDLINGLLQKGDSVHHISPTGFNLIKHDHFFHHGVYNAPVSPFILFFFPQALIQLIRLFHKAKIDAIITYSILEGIFGIILKFFHPDTKFILSVHGDEKFGVGYSGKGKIVGSFCIIFFGFIEKVVIRQADYIFFISEYNRKTILKRTENENRKNTEVVLNDISERIIALSKAPPFIFNGKKNIIGYVGLLYSEGKGLDCLIKAFSIIKSEIPDSLLIIVGDGPDKEILIKMVDSLNLKDEIRFIGFVSNPLPYIRGFDLLVLPSIHEGIATVLIESLYVGTPVIASKVGGTPEVLFYEKLLFEPQNAEALSDKIIDIFQNKNSYEEIKSLCVKRKELLKHNRNEFVIDRIQKIID